MNLLLTDEEMQKVRDDNYLDCSERGAFILEVDVMMWSAKAQLKKVVKYIRQHQWQGHKSVDFDSPRGYMISEDDMQSLLEETK